jgi:hypothetical protein
MTETAGWGVPGFLPPAVAMRARQADAREAIAARQAEDEQEAHREELRQRHLGLYREQAERRGELVSAVALATGQVPGRTVADILAAGAAAGDREDLVTEARLHREGHGDPEPLHVFVDEPVIQQARSANGLRIFHRARRFRAVLEARKALTSAERAAEQSRNDYGLVEGVHPRAGRRP